MTKIYFPFAHIYGAFGSNKNRFFSLDGCAFFHAQEAYAMSFINYVKMIISRVYRHLNFEYIYMSLFYIKNKTPVKKR